MRELNIAETTSVAAGAVFTTAGLLAVLGFVWSEAENIEDFVEGVFHGLED